MASADRCDRCLSFMTRDTFERPLADEVLALRKVADLARALPLEPFGVSWRIANEKLRPLRDALAALTKGKP